MKKHPIDLPETGFIRLADVLAIIPVGKSTWWAGVKSGRFPQPVRLCARISAWRVEDIRCLIEEVGRSQVAAADGDPN